MPLSWFEDPSDYLIDLRPGPGDRFARINDAYAQWALGHGAQFNLTEEYRGAGTDPHDFNFAIAMRDLEAPKGRVISNAQGGPQNTAALRDDLFIGRLPVRAHSVAPGVLGGGITAETDDPWEDDLPEGLNPEEVVIVGVMDDAIQIANPRFQDGAGTSRVDAAWIQDASFVAGPGETAGPGWALHRQFGRVLSRREITKAIKDHAGDEQGLMEALDLVAAPGAPYRPTPLRFASAHGTHVADLAAGYDPSEDAKHRRIVAVQLPVYSTQDTSGAGLLAPAIAGAGFIFNRAEKLSRKLGVPIPVMLNFSYGLGGGHRTGAQVIERALRAQAEAYRAEMARVTGHAPPTVVLVPAGNGHLSRTHASGAAPASGTASLATTMRVQPDDRTASFLEVWVAEGTNSVDLLVTTPEGLSRDFTVELPVNQSDPLAVTNGFVLARGNGSGGPDLGTVIGRVSVDCPSAFPVSGGGQAGAWRVMLSLAPSRALIAGRPVVSPGLWQVACTAHGTDTPVRAWVQRDDFSLGFGVRGRQSYFEDDAYDAHLFDQYTDIAVADQVASDMTRDGTVSGLATRPDPVPAGAEVIAVGSERWDITGPSIYSAAGFAPQNSPQVMAPADCSRVLPGILSTTNRGGAKMAQTGTSMAAPLVARMLADVVAGLPVVDYPSFSAAMHLRAISHNPVRPTAQDPELASNNVVREERCAWGLLDPPTALARDLERGVAKKETPPAATS